MFLWRQPNAAAIARVFERARHAEFNFDAEAVNRAWFFHNQTVVQLGEGESCWQNAVRVLREWRGTRLGWCEFLSRGEPEAGMVIMAKVRHFGFWSLQPSRIIAIDHTERSYGFTIRTLKSHDESGEERFQVDWLPSGEVRFAIRSYSRPANLAGWLALPYVRHLQRRFGRQVAHVMQTI